MDVDRDEAAESVARGPVQGAAWNWRGAVKALAGEPLPQRLREALVELGAQGRRLRLAVEAYNYRLDRMWDSPEEAELLARACREWPEYTEREEARRAYDRAQDVVSAFARSWVEGRAAGEGS